MSRRAYLHTLAVGAVSLSCKSSAERQMARWFAGDLHLGRTVQAAGNFLASVPGRGSVNLEGVLAKGAGWQSQAKEATVLLRNDPKSVDWILSAGIDAISLENNHALDLGLKTRERSAEQLRAKKIQVLAHAHDSQGKPGEAWHQVVAFVGPREERGTTVQDLEEVVAARRQGRRVVLSLHVDSPPSYLPSPKIRGCVEKFLEAGASVVVLHGSHVVGPVERRGDAIIAWGLGNLSFACPCSQQDEGMILSLQGGTAGPLRARVCGIMPGNSQRPVRPLTRPQVFFDLLRALGSSPLKISGAWAEF